MQKTQMHVVTQMPKTPLTPVIICLPVAAKLAFIGRIVAKTPPEVQWCLYPASLKMQGRELAFSL